MNAEPIFTDLIGIMAVILMVGGIQLVAIWLLGQYVGRHGAQGDGHFLGTLDHVIVGEDVAIRRHHKAGAQRAALSLGHAFQALAEEVLEQITEGAALGDVRHRKSLGKLLLDRGFLLRADINHRRAVLRGQFGKVWQRPGMCRYRKNHRYRSGKPNTLSADL